MKTNYLLKNDGGGLCKVFFAPDKITFLSILLLALLSCHKEKTILKLGNENTSPQLKSLDTAAVSFNGGVFHFSTFQNMEIAATYLDSLSDINRIGIETTLGFTSLKTIYDSLHSRIDTISTENRLTEFLSSQSSYLVDINDQIEMSYPFSFFHSIADYDGIFVVDSTVCRIMKNGIFAWRGSSVTQIRQLNIDDSITEDFAAGKFYIAKISKSSVGCGNYQRAESRNDDNTRKVRLSIEVWRYGWFWQICNPTQVLKYWMDYRTTVLVEGFKKNIWGKWIHYKTNLQFKEVYTECYIPTITGFNDLNCTNYFNLQLVGGLYNKNKQKENTRELRVNYIGPIEDMGHTISCPFTNPIPEPIFNKVQGKAKSTGTNNNWAMINCGY
ncbi:MAG: hypothetical protein KGZ82_04970 [Bacteroidales bacterium]|nr:hypothetical protein [Bacteroidales bacterium]